MRISSPWCAGLFYALSAAAVNAGVNSPIPSYTPQPDESFQWQGNVDSIGIAQDYHVSHGGAGPRHLQAWRTRGSMGSRGFSSGYTTGYNSVGGTTMSSPTYTTRVSPYGSSYSGSTSFTPRATPTYASTGSSGTFASGSSSAGTTYYSSGSSSTTYTGGSLSSPTYTGYSGSSRIGSSTSYMGSSGSTYAGSRSPSVSGTTYMGSSSPYSGTSTARFGGVSGGSGSVGGRIFTGSTSPLGSTIYPSASVGARGVTGAPTVTAGQGTFGETYSGSGTTGSMYSGSSINRVDAPTPAAAYTGSIAGGFTGTAVPRPNIAPTSASFSGSSSGMELPTGAATYTGGATDSFTGTGRTRPTMTPAGTAFSGNNNNAVEGPAATAPYTGSISGTFTGTSASTSNTPPAGPSQSNANASIPSGTASNDGGSTDQGDSDGSTGPHRDTNRGRGSSSFRSTGGGETASPLEQVGGSAETTYYLREADGSLTPIEPPPYDQMKPDSYYTDLYLTDQPIRFENHSTKEEQFKTELEKAHASNVESESAQPTQGVMSLPLTEEKKGLM